MVETTTPLINRLLARSQAKHTKQHAKKTKINWDEVHQKILASEAKNSLVETLSEEQLSAIWARRAFQVSQVIQSEDQGDRLELAIIRLGREYFGLDVRYLFDIRLLSHLTRVPRTPPWVAGVVNLRGRIISVLDLQRFLNLPGRENTDGQSNPRHLAVVETAVMELGILVDEVLSMESFPLQKVQEATSVVRGIPAEYVRGVVFRKENGMSVSASRNDSDETERSLLLILDLPALLADKRLIVHEEVV